MGIVVKTQKYIAGSFVDISALPSGNYFVRINKAKNNSVLRFIKL